MTARNQVIMLAAVIALAGAVDFFQRVYVPRSPGTRESNIETPAIPSPPISLAQAQQRLQSWFPVEVPTPDSGATAADASDDASAALPDRGNIAGWRFTLRGVFDAGPVFAVLDVVSTSGGEIEQHRLSTGDTVKGVSVERRSGHSVFLTDGETMLQLALFVEPEDVVTPTNEQD